MLKIKQKKWYLDFSFFEKKGYSEFAQRLKLNREESSAAFRLFFKNLNNEAKETRDAGKIVYKFLKTGKLSTAEEKELKLQFYDLLKVMGVGVPFVMIPGASILIPFLIRIAEKLGRDIIPSSFKKETGDKIEDAF